MRQPETHHTTRHSHVNQLNHRNTRHRADSGSWPCAPSGFSGTPHPQAPHSRRCPRRDAPAPGKQVLGAQAPQPPVGGPSSRPPCLQVSPRPANSSEGSAAGGGAEPTPPARQLQAQLRDGPTGRPLPLPRHQDRGGGGRGGKPLCLVLRQGPKRQGNTPPMKAQEPPGEEFPPPPQTSV